MFSMPITYVDLNGEERTETHYFHLNKAELLRLEVDDNGGLSTVMQQAIDENSNSKLFNIFENILRVSYGVRSEDGRSFIKDPEETKKFMQSEAYSEIFTALVTDEAVASKFMNGIIPENLRNMAQANLAAGSAANK